MSDDYETPRWLTDIAFPCGFFDPCPIGGKKNGPDGLRIEWPTDKLVFINPPYSDPLPWVVRAAYHKGPVALLLPIDVTTEWWTYSYRFKVTFIGSHVAFWEPGDPGQKTLHGGEAKSLNLRRRRAGTFGCSWWWKP